MRSLTLLILSAALAVAGCQREPDAVQNVPDAAPVENYAPPVELNTTPASYVPAQIMDTAENAAPYLDMRVRVFDSAGQEMCCLTMRDLYQQLHQSGYAAQFRVPDDRHLALDGVRANGAERLMFVFSGYGQVGDGWQIDVVGFNEQPIATRFGEWSASPSPLLIQQYRLRPVN